MGYRVFISFKNLDREDNPTPDSLMAEELYHALSQKGINTFYSNYSLKDLAASDFLDAIYAALEQCSIFVAVGSDITHFESRWIKFEARTFQMEYLNGNKPETEYGMITYVTPDLRASQAKFVQPLRDMQSFCSLEDVVEYVTNRLENAAMLKRMHTDEDDDDIRYHSVSLADEIFERRHGVSPATWDLGSIELPNIKLSVLDEIDREETSDENPTGNLSAEESQMNLTGSVILERYKLLAEIGHGGTSTVYLAQDLSDGLIRAVKVLRMPVAAEAVEQEVAMLAMLKHPMVPQFVESMYTSEHAYVVMEYIAGESLQKLVDRDGPQSEARIKNWMIQLCEFLSFVHAKELAYRDMKPGNIMLQRGEKLAVLDYASVRRISRKHGDTVSLGTIGYAAPEQYGSKGTADERTDIYGLGATMYHMLTGEVPSGGMKGIRTMNPNVTSAFEAILERCIQLDPGKRYPNIRALLRDLKELNLLPRYEDKEGIRVPPLPNSITLSL